MILRGSLGRDRQGIAAKVGVQRVWRHFVRLQRISAVHWQLFAACHSLDYHTLAACN